MNTGTVRYAVCDGVYVLEFVGDVHLDIGTRLDAFIDLVRDDTALRGLVVDLSRTEHLDSTSLGLLAKLSMMCNERLHHPPGLRCPEHGMREVLVTNGLEDLFEPCADAALDPGAARELPNANCSEAAVHDNVLDAHRVLMSLSERNATEYKDLVQTLEREHAPASERDPD